MNPSLKEALRFWFKLGWISFGGPAGQIAILHNFLVIEKKWIDEKRFLHALSFCMMLPGPEAQQLATYTGWILHGTKGAILAGLLFILPSVWILLLLSWLYVSYGRLFAVEAIFYGLKPAVLGIILSSLVRLIKTSIKTRLHVFVSLGCLIGMLWLKLSFPIILLFAILVGGISTAFGYGNKKVPEKTEEPFFVKEKGSESENHWRTISRISSVGIFLWATPQIALLLWNKANYSFWKTLSIFFTKAAFLTFGGAYAVLPYIAEASVNELKWLETSQMIDGLALGESTPGPLIMVLPFVGYLAGYHQFGTHLYGGVAFLLTVFYTFLPSFLFILIGSPIFDKWKDNQRLSLLFSFVTAAVVGALSQLTVIFGKAVLFPVNQATPILLFWIIATFFVLHFKKIQILPWIGISSAFGLGLRTLFSL
ncbi:hypothetical protein CH373_06470 [Leptospira perolatii]|uniref:Chromate transporter n=1 Tax=Leptospira perolatii TaxID=2023191 RepID=A0A2M9ZNY8_9LEPT|nr:chromate efflux transporter [Leptospira perolatii]PJZ70905.1 hypothetical protein CH360_05200 [Leptospira perolatii]PJZ73800.1 hypothetical protein CH373_06470 [Leptospira perolatii]